VAALIIESHPSASLAITASVISLSSRTINDLGWNRTGTCTDTELDQIATSNSFELLRIHLDQHHHNHNIKDFPTPAPRIHSESQMAPASIDRRHRALAHCDTSRYWLD